MRTWSMALTLGLTLAAADAQVDYSEAADFDIGEPRFAWVNITGLAALPTAKTDVRQVWVEVNDGGGNRFRKRALLKAQGSWSLKFPKRNFSCQFCEGDWSGTATTGIRIGQWVRQDEFHFKAFYTDFLRGIGEVGYKLFHTMVADRPSLWERGGCGTPSRRARCLPDGFPCAVYLEGKFLGLYAWQLKKSRKNMNMERGNPLHIHLDGNLNNSTLFRGSVQWSQFEVRHPLQPSGPARSPSPPGHRRQGREEGAHQVVALPPRPECKRIIHLGV